MTWAGVLALVTMYKYVVHSLCGCSLDDKFHEGREKEVLFTLGLQTLAPSLVHSRCLIHLLGSLNSSGHLAYFIFLPIILARETNEYRYFSGSAFLSYESYLGLGSNLWGELPELFLSSLLLSLLI